MRKIIALLLALFGFSSAYSQDSQALIKEIKKMALDSVQKQVITPLQDTVLSLRNANITNLTTMQNRVKKLEKDSVNLNKKIKEFEERVAILSEKKIKIERDNLQKQRDSLQRQVDNLKGTVAGLDQKNREKDTQIVQEKQNSENKVKIENENGKKEILKNIASIYMDKKFDDLIKVSTKVSIQRDQKLLNNNVEVQSILSDLETYFILEELLENKIDTAQMKIAQMQLSKIKRQSGLLDTLMQNIQDYKTYNEKLKKTIEKLINLDNQKGAYDNPNLQNKKFSEIILELSNYMYNYYDYGKYPYLSNIILEIIKRKKFKADADITDLLGLL
jgi:hypothetical protein